MARQGSLIFGRKFLVDNEALILESRITSEHWWFAGRRCLFQRIIRRLNLAPESEIIDLGSGSGSNLEMLRQINFHNVHGLDISPTAVNLCHQRGFKKVVLGNICQTGFKSGRFDLALATDVLEHVDDDELALKEIARLLKKDQAALLVVPSFPALWGIQDEISAHVRRYRRGELVKKARAVGLSVERHRYFNFLLCAPIWMARTVLKRVSFGVKNENIVNTPFLNLLLKVIFFCDIYITEIVKVNFGVSEYILAYKRSKNV